MTKITLLHRPIFLLCWLLIGVPESDAKVTEEQARSLSDKIAAIVLSLNQIKTLEVHATSDITQYPGFWEDRGGSGSATSEIIQAYQGKKFLYDIKMTKDGSTYVDYVNAYDGEYFQFFSRASGQLTLGSKEVRKHLIENEMQPALMPFYFILSTLEKNPFAVTPITDFAAPDRWKDFLNHITPSNLRASTFNGLPCFSLDFGKVFDHTSRLECVYSVYFDASNGYPVGWERQKDGTTVQKYSVGKLAQATLSDGRIFLYPSESKLEYFFDSKLAASTITQVKSLRLNSDVEVDFTLDPALAKTIRDADEKTTIAVPK